VVGGEARRASDDGGARRIPAYLINLDRSVERLVTMREMFDRIDVPFERVAAIDGRSLTDEQRAVHLARRGPLALESGELGCLLSHRAIWRRIAAGASDYGAVFEDDVQVSPRLRSLLAASDWIASDADIVKLETHRETVVLHGQTRRATPGFELRRLQSCNIGAAAYIVSRRGADTLLASFSQMRGPVDHDLFDPSHKLFHCLTIYQITPAPCIQYRLFDPVIDARLGMSTIVDRVNDNKALRKAVSKPLSPGAKIARELTRPFRRAASAVRLRWRLFTGEFVSIAVPYDGGPADAERPAAPV